MRIEISRNGQKLGYFEEASINDGLLSGRLRSSDEYYFEGMTTRRPLSDFMQSGGSRSTEPGGLIRIHRDPVKSRRESKRNDLVLMGVLVFAVLVGVGFIVYKDVSAKKERRRHAEMEWIHKKGWGISKSMKDQEAERESLKFVRGEDSEEKRKKLWRSISDGSSGKGGK